MGQAEPPPLPEKRPPWKSVRDLLDAVGIVSAIGLAAKNFGKIMTFVGTIVTIVFSPWAQIVVGLLIVVSGLLFGGALAVNGIKQLSKPASSQPPEQAVSAAPSPVPKPTPTAASTITPVANPSTTPTSSAKFPRLRPGATATVIRRRSLTENLHTEDVGPGTPTPPQEAAKTHPENAIPTTTSTAVEIRPAGRVLTEEQRSSLNTNLVALSGHHIGVYSDWNDEESGKYGYQFFMLFQGLGIDVGKMVGKEMRASPPPPISIDVYTDLPVNENATEVQDALTLRGALVAARLLDPASRINVITNATLTGGKNEVHLMLGPRAAASQ